MRKTITKVFSCAVIFAFLLSCTDGSAGNVVEDWPWEDPAEPDQPAPDPEPEDPNPAILDLGWTNVGDAYGKLPEHIDVYKSPSDFDGKAAVAYIAVADMKSAK